MPAEKRWWVCLHIDPDVGLPTTLPARGRRAARAINVQASNSYKVSAFLMRSATVMPGEWAVYVLTRHGYEYQFRVNKTKDER